MEIVDTVDDIPSVESLLIAHDERKKEIEAREEMFGSVIAQGEEMIESGHHSSEEVPYHNTTYRSIPVMPCHNHAITIPYHALPCHNTILYHTTLYRTTPTVGKLDNIFRYK